MGESRSALPGKAGIRLWALRKQVDPERVDHDVGALSPKLSGLVAPDNRVRIWLSSQRMLPAGIGVRTRLRKASSGSLRGFQPVSVTVANFDF